jgi:anti-sigma factor (TIGR02949 family)
MTAAECKEVFALLSQYIDGELPDDLCQRMAAHIDGCPPCVEFLESLEKTARLCRQMKAEGEPAPLPAEVRHGLKKAYERFSNSTSGFPPNPK